VIVTNRRKRKPAGYLNEVCVYVEFVTITRGRRCRPPVARVVSVAPLLRVIRFLRTLRLL